VFLLTVSNIQRNVSDIRTVHVIFCQIFVLQILHTTRDNTTHINKMQKYSKIILNFLCFYMLQNSKVHPQGDICICSVVRLTCIGVSNEVGRRDRRVCSNTVWWIGEIGECVRTQCFG
jgi:hypothetical protein